MNALTFEVNSTVTTEVDSVTTKILSIGNRSIDVADAASMNIVISTDASYDTSDYNLIYSPKFEIDLINNMEITPVGNWKSWISNGYDMHSKLNINPLFLNPHNNDFRLHDESEAFKLGFQKIPDVISYDC